MRSRQRFSDMYGQGCQGEACLFLVIHTLQTAHIGYIHAHTHTLVTPRGVPGLGLGLSIFNHTNTHTHSLNVVCLLVTSREVPGEGLSVLV